VQVNEWTFFHEFDSFCGEVSASSSQGSGEFLGAKPDGRAHEAGLSGSRPAAAVSGIGHEEMDVKDVEIPRDES
jgi:hypothetical protein